MTKKHFIALAAEIKNMTDRNAARQAAAVIITVASADNARFDANRFLTACGLN